LRGVVVELAAVIALECTNRTTELCGDPSEEVGEGVKGATEGSLEKMREVIQNDQVVFVTREAKDRRSPEITMNKVKGLSSPGRGNGKGKLRMTIELAGMIEALRRASAARDI
jgi:hypothetical protein